MGLRTGARQGAGGPPPPAAEGFGLADRRPAGHCCPVATLLNVGRPAWAGRPALAPPPPHPRRCRPSRPRPRALRAEFIPCGGLPAAPHPRPPARRAAPGAVPRPARPPAPPPRPHRRDWRIRPVQPCGIGHPAGPAAFFRDCGLAAPCPAVLPQPALRCRAWACIGPASGAAQRRTVPCGDLLRKFNRPTAVRGGDFHVVLGPQVDIRAAWARFPARTVRRRNAALGRRRRRPVLDALPPPYRAR